MNIGIITGSRAEYGLLGGLIQEFKNDPEIDTKVIATGAHATGKYIDIKADEIVEMLLDSNTKNGIGKSIGLGVIGFAELFKYRKYDAVIVLGDRFEIYSAVTAAYSIGVPIIHIHGGEETTGSLDNGYRHAISHMSDYHFVAHEIYRTRLINFGIAPEKIYCVGTLGVDGIEAFRSKKKKCSMLRAMACYYPDPQKMLDILSDIKKETMETIVIKPNPDIAYKDDVGVSFNRNDFLKILSTCDFIIGNSSAGIIEAPALGVPTINIGDRQKGRLMASSIINCELNEIEVREAIDMVLSDEFQESIKYIARPYKGYNVAKQIKDKVKAIYGKSI